MNVRITQIDGKLPNLALMWSAALTHTQWFTKTKPTTAIPAR